MFNKILSVLGVLMLFGVCGGLECGSMTIGQAVAWLLVIMPVTFWSFKNSEWYEPCE